MHDYEMRIVNNGVQPPIVIQGCYYSDDAAIRAAGRMAGTKAFEVWRDIDCIYRAPPKSSSPIGHAA